VAQEALPATRSGLRLTRRSVLAGAVVSGAVRPVFGAAPPTLEIEYGDPLRRSLLFVYRPTPTERHETRLATAAFGDPDDPSPSRAARFVRWRTQQGWTALVENASFPGTAPYRIRIDIGWGGTLPDPVAGSSLTMQVALPHGRTVTLATGAPGGAATLIDWLRPGPAGAAEIVSGDVPSSFLKRLGGVLFGESFSLNEVPSVRLAFACDGFWRMRPVGKSLFRALPDEGIAPQFDRLAFGFLSNGSGPVVPTDKTLPSPLTIMPPGTTAGARPEGDVRLLFEGQGAPPAVPPAADGTEPRVLFALAELKPLQGTLALGRVPGRPPGDSPLTQLILEPSTDTCRRALVAWRKSGDAPPTLALRSGLTLSVIEAGRNPVLTRFPCSTGILWRGRGEDNALHLVAALEPLPTQTGHAVDTRYGTFTVVPLPTYVPRPGLRSQVPAIRIARTWEHNGTHAVTQFTAPLALLQGAIGLDQTGIAPYNRAISTLLFEETECLFRFAGVPLNHSWTGVAKAGTQPPQAEGVVYLGVPPEQDPPVRIALGRARLSIRRPRDMLSLTYRFQDLLLERDGTNGTGSGSRARWWIVPDRRAAAFAARRPTLPSPEVAPRCSGPLQPETSPARYDVAHDPRPVLVVEFPPQHIAERAFLRQFLPVPIPPAAAPETAVGIEDAVVLRDGRPGPHDPPEERVKPPLRRRLERRGRISKDQLKHAGASDAFKRFVKEFAEEAGKEGLPADQCIYVGAAFLDPAASRVARRVARRIEQEQSNVGAPDQSWAPELRALPEVDLPPDVVAELWQSFVPAGSAPAPSQDKLLADQEGNIEFLAKREAFKDRRDHDYASFRAFYVLDRAKRYCHLSDKDRADAPNAPKRPPFFAGREHFLRFLDKTADGAERQAAVKGIALDLKAYNAHAAKLEGDAFCIPVEARVSGRSRLAFRIPADDYEGGRPDVEGRPAGALPFQLAALTNWGSLDLAVVRRAEKLFDPMQNGRAARRWDRRISRDDVQQLIFQGLTRGDAGSIREAEGRADACPAAFKAHNSRITGIQRMAEIATASAKAPHWNETSIELPFRLMLSPAQDALFQTPLPLPGGLCLERGPSDPVPLWFARLDEPANASSLRAVWSPDYRPEALLGTGIGTPPRGPWAPWAMPRSVTTSDPFSTKETPEQFRTGLDAYDRHELVVLSSVHGLPVRGRRQADGTLAPNSQQMAPPAGFALQDATPEPLVDGADPQDWSSIYQPQPLGVTELTLTALGGTLEADTSFVPPAAARVGVRSKGRSLFDALTVERWRQSTVLGRDIRVEVVYRGFLFPCGHRASLVKLTERRFMKHPTSNAPVAFLVQRHFLRIGYPEKRYPAIGQPNGGRRWPVERLDILTLETPDLVDPAADVAPATVPPNTGAYEGPNGRIFLSRDGKPPYRSGLAFWPRTRAGNSSEVKFEFQIDRRGTRINMPQIFVDSTTANDPEALRLLVLHYNRPDPRRQMHHAGDKRRYAPETKPDETSFETIRWDIAAEGREQSRPDDKLDNTNFDFSALLQGADQPPFYPIIERSEIRIAQVDRMLGQASTPIATTFEFGYTVHGFPGHDLAQSEAKSDVYLLFDQPVAFDPGTAGDRTGGTTRPKTTLVALSRDKGPVGGVAPPAPPPTAHGTAVDAKPATAPRTIAPVKDLDVGSFFDPDAKILGILTFGDALKFLTKGLQSAPAFKEVTHYASTLLEDAGKDVGAAVAKVRNSLLVPLRDALDVLALDWAEALRPAGNGSAAPSPDLDEAVNRLATLYPDVGAAYRNLRTALDKAIDTSPAIRDVEELFGHFAEIYASGRRFVAAIERVAADPVAPVRAAVRDAFNRQISALLVTIGGTTAEVLDTVHTAVKDVELSVNARVIGLVTAPELKVWRRLVFALPVAPSGPDAGQVRATMDVALEEALRSNSGAWIDALVQNEDDPGAAALAIAVELTRRLETNTDPLVKQALNVWKDNGRSAGERVQGLLFDAVMKSLRTFVKAARGLTAWNDSLPALRVELRKVADEALNLIRPALDDLELKNRRVCTTMLSILRTSIQLVTPATSAAMPLAAVGAVEDSVPPLVELDAAVRRYADLARPQEEELARSLDRLGDRIDIAAKDLLAAAQDMRGVATALDEASRQFASVTDGGLSDSVCTAFEGTLTEFPLDALSAVAALRKRLMEALAAAAKALHGLGAPFNDEGGILAVLQAFDGDLKAVLAPGLPATLEAARINAVQKTVAVARQATRTARVLVQVAEAATSLKALPTRVVSIRVAIEDLAKAFTEAGQQRIADTLTQEFGAILGKLEQARADVANDLDKTVLRPLSEIAAEAADTREKLNTTLASLLAVARDADAVFAKIADSLVRQAEQVLIQAAAKRLTASAEIAAGFIDALFTLLNPILRALATVQGKIVNERNKIHAGLVAASTGQPQPGDQSLDGILKDLGKATVADLAKLMLVPRPPELNKYRTAPNKDGKPETSDQDFLTAERDELAGHADRKAPFTPEHAAALAGLFTDWAEGRASAAILLVTLSRIGERVLSGDLSRIVDLEGARRSIEAKLKEMVPARVALSYDFTARMENVGTLFLPKGDARLAIAARATYDLLQPSTPPVFTAEATLDPFDINLFGVVTLLFDGARFVNDSRKGSDFKIAYKDFQLGPQAAFIKPLEPYFNPKGSGPYVRPANGYPGIEAGYSLFLGIISVGSLSFTNVSLNASCQLPFDNREAVFSASIGRKDKPFLISALPYTGGGFLALLANSRRILGFEASFEFGGGGAFAFGPLQGQGRISTGIYVNRVDAPDGAQGAQIDGFFYAGGEAIIACFALAATLVVRMAQQRDGSMDGSAVFTYSFSVGIADVEFRVGVRRNLGRGFSTADIGQSGPVRLASLGDMGSMEGVLPAKLPGGPVVKAAVTSQDSDWTAYRSYFASNIDGFAA